MRPVTFQPREFPPYISYLMVTLMSVALLAMQATIPFKVKELGGGFDAVGFLFTWTSVWYVLSGLFLSRFSHHIGPRRMMLVSLAICAALVFVLSATTALWQLYAVLAAYFVTICLFWSAAEHASTSLHSHLTITQSTAIYCVSFSLGNAIGLVLSTSLQRQTLAVPFFVATGLTLAVWGLTWWTVSPQAGFQRSTPHDIAAFPAAHRQRLRRSLLIARIGIVGSYGAFAVVTVFLPRYLYDCRGMSKPVAGGLTSLSQFVMAATFAWHGRRTGWEHNLLPVRLAPLIAAGGLLIVCWAQHPLLLALGAVVTGIVAATGYTHDLYYALEEPGHRAQRAGIHEALVGIAYLLPAVLSGFVTRWTNNPQGVFWVGIALALAVGGAQAIALLRTDTSSRA
jgi:predicted MFS family arabinose efflux permease